MDLPSGYVKIAIEHRPFIVDSPIENGDFYSYVSLSEGTKVGDVPKLTKGYPMKKPISIFDIP